MGDPNAFVADRWWARLSEKPTSGIYANAGEGKISSDATKGNISDYQALQEAVSAVARSRGRSIRDFSADVWTGVRETVKKENKLFGTPFRGSALQGESKSYADIFNDLVKDKASKLGMTVKKFEEKLRKGDANLLTLMLMSPIMYPAYRLWEEDQQQQRIQGRVDAKS